MFHKQLRQTLLLNCQQVFPFKLSGADQQRMKQGHILLHRFRKSNITINTTVPLCEIIKIHCHFV